ncbi:MAG: OmpA family protein [Pseudomonadota bacterium]
MNKTVRRLSVVGGLAMLVVAAFVFLPFGETNALRTPFTTASGTQTAGLDDRSARRSAPRDERRSEAPRRGYRPARVQRELAADGWSNLEFIDRELPTYIVRGCLDGRRFEARVDRYAAVLGRRSLGRCRQVSETRDRRRADLTGFDDDRDTARRDERDSRERITQRDERTARRDDLRRRQPEPPRMPRSRVAEVEPDRDGDDLFREDDGFAPREDRDDVRATKRARHDEPGYRMNVRDAGLVLAGLGYQQVSFSDQELPVYVADGCLERHHFRLRMNRRGDITLRERIGRCYRRGERLQDESSLSRDQLRELVEGQGFNRVIVTDTTEPRYVAQACKGSRRLELTLNTYGAVTDRRQIGACREIDGENVLPLEQVTKLLERRRYYRIRYTDRELPWYRADVCRNRKAFSVLLNRWGDIARRRQTGVCAAPERIEVASASVQPTFDVAALENRTRIDADECQDYMASLLDDNTINFASDSAKISDESFELLDRLSFVASRCPETQIEIAGHTDSSGSAGYNMTLSKRRAGSVVSYLRGKGIESDRLEARGYGEERPIASNKNERGKARNRRIEFVATWGS